MEAIAVVTTPETTVAGSPALMVSNVSGFHSTPMFFLMRSMTSVAEMGGLAVSAAGQRERRGHGGDGEGAELPSGRGRVWCRRQLAIS